MPLLAPTACSSGTPHPTVTVTKTVTAAPGKSTPVAAAGKTLLSTSGQGDYTTVKFTTPADWNAYWSYNMNGEGPAPFDISAGGCEVSSPACGDNTSPSGDGSFTGPNAEGDSGSGVVHVYNDPGVHWLTTSTGGSWTLKVVSAS